MNKYIIEFKENVNDLLLESFGVNEETRQNLRELIILTRKVKKLLTEFKDCVNQNKISECLQLLNKLNDGEHTTRSQDDWGDYANGLAPDINRLFEQIIDEREFYNKNLPFRKYIYALKFAVEEFYDEMPELEIKDLLQTANKVGSFLSKSHQNRILKLLNYIERKVSKVEDIALNLGINMFNKKSASNE